MNVIQLNITDVGVQSETWLCGHMEICRVRSALVRTGRWKRLINNSCFRLRSRATFADLRLSSSPFINKSRKKNYQCVVVSFTVIVIVFTNWYKPKHKYYSSFICPCTQFEYGFNFYFQDFSPRCRFSFLSWVGISSEESFTCS